MSDLADFELAELRSGEPDADQCERAAREIERHRAARDADAERVRSVVREAVELAATKAVDSALGEVCRQVGQMGHVLKEARREGMASPLSAIAHRAAEQLAGAGVGLSVEERAMLRGLALDSRIAAAEAKRRGSDTWSDAHTSRAKLLDRLLASPPAPDHTAAICALLDSDMPAGDLRKAMAELVGRR